MRLMSERRAYRRPKPQYPNNWPAIRRAVLHRAGNRCEGSPRYPDCRAENGQPHPVTGSVVVLTVGHLFDDDTMTQDLTRLRAWCQRCHTTYDARMHAARAADTRVRKGLGLLPVDMSPQDRAAAVYANACRAALAAEEKYRDQEFRRTPLRRLTASDLAAIKARAQAATRGPWHWTHMAANAESSAAYVYLLQGTPRRDATDRVVMELQWQHVRPGVISGMLTDANAEFIAHARVDIPRLVAEVKRLQRRIAQLEAQLNEQSSGK